MQNWDSVCNACFYHAQDMLPARSFCADTIHITLSETTAPARCCLLKATDRSGICKCTHCSAEHSAASVARAVTETMSDVKGNLKRTAAVTLAMPVDARNLAKAHDVSTRRTVHRRLMIGTNHHQLAKLPGGLGGLTSCAADEFCPNTLLLPAAWQLT